MQPKVEVISSGVPDRVDQPKEDIVIFSQDCEPGEVASVTIKHEDLLPSPGQCKLSPKGDSNAGNFFGDMVSCVKSSASEVVAVVKSEENDGIESHGVVSELHAGSQLDVGSQLDSESHLDAGSQLDAESQFEAGNHDWDWVESHDEAGGSQGVKNRFQDRNHNHTQSCPRLGLPFSGVRADTRVIMGHVDTQQVHARHEDIGLLDPGHIDSRHIDHEQSDLKQMSLGQIDHTDTDHKQMSLGNIDCRQMDVEHIDSRDIDRGHIELEQIDPEEITSQADPGFSHQGVIDELEDFNFLFRLEAQRALKHKSGPHLCLRRRTGSNSRSAARLHSVRRQRSTSGASTVHIEIFSDPPA